MMRIIAVLCFLSLAPQLQAQAGALFPLVSVRVDGVRNLTEEQVIAASGLPVGSRVNEKAFEQAMQRLLECGYIDRAGYRYEPAQGGYALTWEVQEVAAFYPVKFPELKGKEEEAKAALRAADPLFGDRIPPTQNVLARYAKVLNEKFKLTDEHDILRGKVNSDNKGDLFIEFVAERPLPTIYKVDFKGNRLLPGEELRPPAAASAVGMVYDEEQFRKVLELRIVPIYEKRGRLRVRFPLIEVSPSPGLNAVDVMVTVDEGEEYKLRSVKVDGLGANNEEYARLGEFQTDLPADMSLVSEGAKKIVAAVKRNGYIDAKIHELREMDDEAKAVDVELIVEPGGRYSFDSLEIRGLDIIAEPAIRKMWKMEKGDPFNPEYPDAFLERVRAEAVLDNLGATRSRADLDEVTRTVKVVLFFEGQKPQPQRRRVP
jgi:outer membrane protein assembly factor BamA